MAELAELREQCLNSLYLCTENVLKYLDNDAKDAELDALKNCVKKYCAMEAMQDLEIQACVIATREIDASSLDSLEEKYNANLNMLLTRKRPNIDNHPFLRKFEKTVKNGLKTPSQNLDESDIAITETQEPNLDPITKKPIEDPVRNTLCSHLYERATILSHINNRNRAKCPVAGCGNKQPVQVAHLVEDAGGRRTQRRHSELDVDGDSQ